MLLVVAWVTAGSLVGSPPDARAATSSGPDVPAAIAYLTAPAQLVGGTHAEMFAGFADVGLTTDIAYALAATGNADGTLAAVAAWLKMNSSAYTGIGTNYAAGGSIGKIALLAEITGYDPTDFGGGDLIAALDATRCTTTDAAKGCVAPGGYAYTPSMFAQTLAMMAMWRGGDRTTLTEPIIFLEAMQLPDGSFPSILHAPGMTPSGPGALGEVDSTAMAAMALALVPGPDAAHATADALAWIASTQLGDGGFPGAAGDSVNSAASAIQALSLDPTTYATQIAVARSFLAANQNADGGFRVASGVGQPTSSDLRASAQAVSGVVGTSFAALDRPVDPNAPAVTDAPTSSTTTSTLSATTSTTSAPTSAPATTDPTTTGPDKVTALPTDNDASGSMGSPGPDTSVPPKSAESDGTSALANTGIDGRLLLGGTTIGIACLVLGAVLLATRRRSS